MSNTLFPAFVKLDGLFVLVVGGGRIALSKVEQLLGCGALVTLVSPEAVPALVLLSEEGRLGWRPREYRSEDLEGMDLVVSATDDGSLNRRVSEEARARHLLVNVVDCPELCTFYMAATVSRGDIKIAVSTNGKSPSMAQRIRDEIGGVIGPEHARLLDILGALRPEVQARLPGAYERRRALFDRIVESQALELLRSGEEGRAMALIQALVEAAAAGESGL